MINEFQSQGNHLTLASDTSIKRSIQCNTLNNYDHRTLHCQRSTSDKSVLHCEQNQIRSNDYQVENSCLYESQKLNITPSISGLVPSVNVDVFDGNILCNFENKNESSIYHCLDCNQTFKTKVSFIYHKKFHTGKKNYICSVCSKVLLTKTSLARHSRCHTGQKLYECSVCYKKFISPRSLFRHKATHMIRKNYKCTRCDRYFNFKCNIAYHLRSHMRKVSS